MQCDMVYGSTLGGGYFKKRNTSTVRITKAALTPSAAVLNFTGSLVSSIISRFMARIIDILWRVLSILNAKLYE